MKQALDFNDVSNVQNIGFYWIYEKSLTPFILESNGASQISLNSSKPPLCLRILMKSKDRMIVRQEDGRKPVISLTTLLVADSTGFI